MREHADSLSLVTLPMSSERLPLFVVGDIHGCADEFVTLLKEAKKRIKEFQLICVGDLFTKGPDPVGVFTLIQEHKAICIMGNHDWALMSSIAYARKHGVHALPEHSQQTHHLIRNHKLAIHDFLKSLPHGIKTETEPQMVRKGWESHYPTLIVHAGIDCIQGLENTTERMLLTVRYVRWEDVDGQKKLALVPAASRVEMRTSPDALARRVFLEERFRWHELHKGPELIIFGHDAKQGLFRKTLANGRPICVGIDTGCTYGRTLTGYFPEFDDAIQVPARRMYFDIEKNIILSKPLRQQMANV